VTVDVLAALLSLVSIVLLHAALAWRAERFSRFCSTERQPTNERT